MPKTVERLDYLNTEEVRDLFGASKKRFYTNIRPHLRVYHFDAKRTAWFRKQDALDLMNGKVARRANIRISGILTDWTSWLRNQGFQVDTQVCSIDKAFLPEDAAGLVAPDMLSKPFIKRAKISLVEGAPICFWATYYPLELVAGETLAEMKSDLDLDVVKHIKERHGLVIGRATDRYTARLASLQEQELLRLVVDEPVLILQRSSTTADGATLILYSDMVLLGSWFAPEHTYPVINW